MTMEKIQHTILQFNRKNQYIRFKHQKMKITNHTIHLYQLNLFTLKKKYTLQSEAYLPTLFQLLQNQEEE
jgi:hypothetical protein